MTPLMAVQIVIAGIEGFIKVMGSLQANPPVVNPDGSVDVTMTITVNKSKLDGMLAQQESDSAKNLAEIARRKTLPNQ